jgi:hypothetical protein
MRVLTFRTDTASEKALAELTADGASVSEAIRRALLEAARQRRRAEMRRQAEALALDPEDLAESRAILAEMETLRAW